MKIVCEILYKNWMNGSMMSQRHEHFHTKQRIKTHWLPHKTIYQLKILSKLADYQINEYEYLDFVFRECRPKRETYNGTW